MDSSEASGTPNLITATLNAPLTVPVLPSPAPPLSAQALLETTFDLETAAQTLPRQTPPNLSQQHWQVFAAAACLVSVPVFFQAPLVRSWPELSLLLTVGWAGLAVRLLNRSGTKIWGELLLGFTYTWLAGSLYWGWWRWEPTLHLPIEAIALPIVLWSWRRGWGKVGHHFYLGSLLGTAITDLYFYLMGLIPYWRQLMQVPPQQAGPIFQQALTQMNTPWGLTWIGILASVLLGLGIWSWQKRSLAGLAFSGAIFSTLLVDGLFGLAAWLA